MDDGAVTVLAAGYTVACLVLVAVAARAYLQSRNGQVAVLGLAFAVLLGKGLLLSYAMFRSSTWAQAVAGPGLLLDTLAVALLYVAVLRPP